MKKEQDEIIESEPKRIKLDDCSTKTDLLPAPEEKAETVDKQDLDSEIDSSLVNLLDFSDDVLLIIFSSLHPEDLLSMSASCIRLSNLVRDKTLWEHVDFRPHIIPLRNLKKFIKFFQNSTKFIATRGPATESSEQLVQPSISKSFLKGVGKNCPNLETLILENHLLDSSKVKLEDFPASLEHLVLKSCHLTHMIPDRSYFYGLDALLPKLKSLDLTMCRWFVPHSLLALSKSRTLEKLNLTGCDVSDCLPYASLAANFGFTTLKVLDLSFTEVSDTEVTCFNSCVLLQELILRGGSGVVTDNSITSYGGPPQTTLLRYSDVEVVRGRPPTRLTRLVVTGYDGITDATLRHAAAHMHHLRQLDVSNTSCSKPGLTNFASARPEVNLLHSHGDL